MKKIFIIPTIILLNIFFNINVLADTTWQESYEYTKDDVNKEITLNKYKSDEKEITVPSIATINNNDYKVSFSKLTWQEKKNIIEKITINENVIFPIDSTGMFKDFINIKELNLKGANTTKVTQMTEMFYNCKKLKQLDLSSFDTSNVINMNSMFAGLENIEKLDLSNFNTKEVIDMSSMFAGNSNLKQLNLSSFTTKNTKNMNNMFGSITESGRTIHFGNKYLILDISSFEINNLEPNLVTSPFNTTIDYNKKLFNENTKVERIVTPQKIDQNQKILLPYNINTNNNILIPEVVNWYKLSNGEVDVLTPYNELNSVEPKTVIVKNYLEINIEENGNLKQKYIPMINDISELGNDYVWYSDQEYKKILTNQDLKPNKILYAKSNNNIIDQVIKVPDTNKTTLFTTIFGILIISLGSYLLIKQYKKPF